MGGQTFFMSLETRQTAWELPPGGAVAEEAELAALGLSDAAAAQIFEFKEGGAEEGEGGHEDQAKGPLG